MKKRGFTIIELLAVIVILALIVLILTPAVIDVIENARLASAKRSIDMYGKAVENAIYSYKIDNNSGDNIKPYMLYKSWNGKQDYIEYSGNEVLCDVRILDSKVVNLSNCVVKGRSVKEMIEKLEESEEDYVYASEENFNNHIGELVNYNSGTGWEEGVTENNKNWYRKWKILGEENGQIKLISSHYVETGVQLSGKNDYLTGVEKLDNLCAKFGNGVGADYARSLKEDDIILATGYNPLKTADGFPAQKGSINEYGNKVTYTMRNGVLNYSSANGAIDSSSKGATVYYKIDGSNLKNGESITIESTWTYYDVSTLYKPGNYGYDFGIKKDSPEFKTLFSDLSQIWLANKDISTKGDYTSYGIRHAGKNNGDIRVQRKTLYKSNGEETAGTGSVLAVVYLDPAAKLVKQDDGTWNIEI